MANGVFCLTPDSWLPLTSLVQQYGVRIINELSGCKSFDFIGPNRLHWSFGRVSFCRSCILKVSRWRITLFGLWRRRDYFLSQVHVMPFILKSSNALASCDLVFCCIPKHCFLSWLAIRDRLSTRNSIRF